VRALRVEDLPWVPSPAPGVERRMLHREGGEVAVATSIVRYAPGASFPSHVHGGGEEILVLSGTFSDEHGDHPAGTWLVNPIGTAHAPFSEHGCTLFVRLRQLGPEASAHRVCGPLDVPRALSAGVCLERIVSGQLDGRGHELLVLEGTLGCGGEVWPAHSWLRWEPGIAPELQAERAVLVWHKVLSHRDF
jgi:hypothetical protein